MKSIFIIALLVCSVFGQVEQKEKETAQTDATTAADVKLSTTLGILTTENLTPDVYLQAIADGLDAIFKSRIIVLPSKSTMKEKEGFEMVFFNKTMEMMDQFIDALETHATTVEAAEKTQLPGKQKTSTDMQLSVSSSKVGALDAWDLLLLTKEMLSVLSTYTMKCDPNVDWNLQPEDCSFLKDTDEGGDFIDSVLKDTTNMKSLRAPFFFLNMPYRPGQYIVAHQTGNLKKGECSAIVETSFGCKAILRTAMMTLWNMPLAEGRSLYGQKHFIFEWIPAEYIKTLTLCNNVASTETQTAGGLTKTWDTSFVHMRGTHQFWRLWTLNTPQPLWEN